MPCRSDRRIPTEAQIVDVFHGVAEAIGRYDRDDCVEHAIAQLTPDCADDALREDISAAVHRVWQVRMDLPGVT